MAYLIGIDEAGYGPNLGPLVVSATAWQVPEAVRGSDLYRQLGPEVTAAGKGHHPDGAGPIRIADSKRVYKPGGGLGALERALLPALAVVGYRPASWRAVWDQLAPGSHSARDASAWYVDYDAPVPVDLDRSEIDPVADRLARACGAAGVRLVAIRSRPVFAGEFNRLVAAHGTKGALLSHVTLSLASRLLAGLPEGPVTVICDKHGGRNRYRDLLARQFVPWLIEVHGESRARSVYRFGPPGGRVEVRFQANAETCLPVALASMTSKYLRELAMTALNAFWQAHLPGLRRTAGYPQDARRFRVEIDTVRARLGIDEAVLWRFR